jgi:hypothetical protein
MADITCWDCRMTIPEPSKEHRYCPYCGFAYVLPCAGPLCLGRPSTITLGKETFCGTCASVYRYDPRTREAIYVEPAGPFQASGAEAALPLVDLHPSDGDPLSEHALGLTQYYDEMRYQGAKEVTPLGGTAIAAIQARHQRIYVISAFNGKLYALNGDTLALIDGWTVNQIPAWQERTSPQQATLLVTESVMLIAHQGQLHAYSAGDGAALFTLRLSNYRSLQFTALRDRLLVLGRLESGQERVLCYDLASLCKSNGQNATPLHDWALPPNYGEPIPLPKVRCYAHDANFFVISEAGALYAVNPDSEEPKLMFLNHGRRPIRAMGVGMGLGALVLEPTSNAMAPGLLTFDPYKPPVDMAPVNVDGLTLYDRFERLTIWKQDIFLLDQEGYLKRISADDPLAERPRYMMLAGNSRQPVYQLSLLPYRDRLFVLLHTQENDRFHRLRQVEMDTPGEQIAQSITGFAPMISDRVQYAICGKWLYLANLTAGAITRLSGLPAERKEADQKTGK